MAQHKHRFNSRLDFNDGMDDCSLAELRIAGGSILAVAAADGSASEPLLVQCVADGPAAAPEPQAPLKQLPFATRQAVANASQISDWLCISGSMAAQSKPALRALVIPFALGDRTQNLMLRLPDQQTEPIEPYLPAAFGTRGLFDGTI